MHKIYKIKQIKDIFSPSLNEENKKAKKLTLARSPCKETKTKTNFM